MQSGRVVEKHVWSSRNATAVEWRFGELLAVRVCFHKLDPPLHVFCVAFLAQDVLHLDLFLLRPSLEQSSALLFGHGVLRFYLLEGGVVLLPKSRSAALPRRKIVLDLLQVVIDAAFVLLRTVLELGLQFGDLVCGLLDEGACLRGSS